MIRFLHQKWDPESKNMQLALIYLDFQTFRLSIAINSSSSIKSLIDSLKHVKAYAIEETSIMLLPFELDSLKKSSKF